MNKLIEFLQDDLKNERLHMNFYLHAASMVAGPHREEYKEYFMKEAQSEMEHVKQFADAIVYLGGIPGVIANEISSNIVNETNLSKLLAYAAEQETKVADNYADRMNYIDIHSHSKPTADETWLHLFYEDQLQDSWAASKELKQLLLHI